MSENKAEWELVHTGQDETTHRMRTPLGWLVRSCEFRDESSSVALTTFPDANHEWLSDLHPSDPVLVPEDFKFIEDVPTFGTSASLYDAWWGNSFDPAEYLEPGPTLDRIVLAMRDLKQFEESMKAAGKLNWY